MKSLSDFITASRLFGASGEHPGGWRCAPYEGRFPSCSPEYLKQDDFGFRIAARYSRERR
jgi:hypothetical protein